MEQPLQELCAALLSPDAAVDVESLAAALVKVQSCAPEVSRGLQLQSLWTTPAAAVS